MCAVIMNYARFFLCGRPPLPPIWFLSHFEGVVVVFFYHDVLFERKIGFFFDIESFEI